MVDSIFFRTFASRNKKAVITIKSKSSMNKEIKSFDLSTEQHEIAVDMVNNNKRKVGSYTLEEVDGEIANVWIADAHSEGNAEYAEILRKALAESAELYTLTDHLGEFSQPIGEVAVFYN